MKASVHLSRILSSLVESWSRLATATVLKIDIGIYIFEEESSLAKLNCSTLKVIKTN